VKTTDAPYLELTITKAHCQRRDLVVQNKDFLLLQEHYSLHLADGLQLPDCLESG
jgi:hypothetical protein